MAESEIANQLRRRGQTTASYDRYTPQEFGGDVKNWWQSMNPLQQVSMAPIPVVSDLAGVAGDVQMYAEQPETRSFGNYALSAAGLLPFVPGAAGIIAGRRAKTLKPETVELAEQLRDAGASRDEIWKATGKATGQPTFFDERGQLKFEIDDSQSALTDLAEQKLAREGDDARYIGWQEEGFSHPDLYEAYPDTKDIDLSINNNPRAQSGFHTPKTSGDEMTFGRAEEIGIDSSPSEARRINLHELQHGVQGREGFAGGGSPSQFEQTRWDRLIPLQKKMRQRYRDWQETGVDPYGSDNYSLDQLREEILKVNEEIDLLKNQPRMSPLDKYKRLAGEAESRAVEARRDLSMQDRIDKPFWESYDVPEDEFIYRYDGGEALSVPKTKRLYRGLSQEFDPNFDVTATDAPTGYSTWTDNPELARRYAGDTGYVYSIDLPLSMQGDDIIDAEGERALFFNNQKPAGIDDVSGEEYLVYLDHDDYSNDMVSLADDFPTDDEIDQILGQAQQDPLTLFHGTDVEFDEFDPYAKGGFSSPDTEGVITLTPDYDIARRYAVGDSTRVGDRYRKMIYDDYLERDMFEEVNPRVIQAQVDGNVKTVDMGGEMFDSRRMIDEQNLAREEGFSAIRFANMNDDTFYNPTGGLTETVQVLDPQAVRILNPRYEPNQNAGLDINDFPTDEEIDAILNGEM